MRTVKALPHIRHRTTRSKPTTRCFLNKQPSRRVPQQHARRVPPDRGADTGPPAETAGFHGGCRTNKWRCHSFTTPRSADASGAPLRLSEKCAQLICPEGTDENWCPITTGIRCAGFVRQPPCVGTLWTPAPEASAPTRSGSTLPMRMHDRPALDASPAFGETGSSRSACVWAKAAVRRGSRAAAPCRAHRQGSPGLSWLVLSLRMRW